MYFSNLFIFKIIHRWEKHSLVLLISKFKLVSERVRSHTILYVACLDFVCHCSLVVVTFFAKNPKVCCTSRRETQCEKLCVLNPSHGFLFSGMLLHKTSTYSNSPLKLKGKILQKKKFFTLSLPFEKCKTSWRQGFGQRDPGLECDGWRAVWLEPFLAQRNHQSPCLRWG